jgi:hypothetical protein
MTRPPPTPLDRAVRRTVIGHFVTVVGALVALIFGGIYGVDYYGGWYWGIVAVAAGSLLISAAWTCWLLPRLGALRAGLRRPPRPPAP